MADRSDTENNGKVSDSAYSNSRSNSQSRRSHSSQSAKHSGSNSSGSSGYSGNPSSTKENKSHNKKIKQKNPKQKKEDLKEDQNKNQSGELVKEMPPASQCISGNDDVDKDQVEDGAKPSDTETHFSCVVSMQNGTIMYATQQLGDLLGYPNEMWVGRSFIDFIHPRDQRIFAALISNRDGLPFVKGLDQQAASNLSMYCRLRRYNSLCNAGFGVKPLTYLPFNLLITYEDHGWDVANCASMALQTEIHFIVIKAALITSAYKDPMELICKIATFIMRHSALGVIEHVDSDSVPYLGYMPHDLVGRCAIKMYHPEDLANMRRVYEKVVRSGQTTKTSMRMLTQNADYVKVETQLSCFVNPWSRKLEYVTGHYKVIQGPWNLDIFGNSETDRSPYTVQEVRIYADIMRTHILETMSESLTKPAEIAKQQMNQKCYDVTTYMDKFKELKLELRLDCHEHENSLSEKDSVLLGGVSPHHDYCESNSASTDTALSYNQMNYKHNLQRFFDSEPITHGHDKFNEVPFEEFIRTERIRTGCLSPSVSCIVKPIIMECDKYEDQLRGRLTEATLKKHDVEMTKVLAKQNRESRNKNEKKTLSRQRLKHLARCNIYHDHNAKAAVEMSSLPSNQPSKPAAEHSQGTKRDATNAEIPDRSQANKLCKPNSSISTFERQAIPLPLTNISASGPSLLCTQALWAGHCVSNISMHTNTFVSTISPSKKARKMPPLSPLLPHPLLKAGLISMFLPPQNAANQIPVMVYNHIYGEPYVYTPDTPMVRFQCFNQEFQPFDEKVPQSLTVKQEPAYEELMQTNSTNPTNSTSFANEQRNSSSDQDISNKTDDAATEAEMNSSFYSSFLKTDSGSDDNQKSSSDKDSAARNRSKCLKWVRGQNTDMYMDVDAPGYNVKTDTGGFTMENKRKMDPPWMEQVSPTTDLFYRYKMMPKDGKKVLEADKKFLANLHQSQQVNSQLAQLYIDLQQQDAATTLHIEEGITSSGSSGEESCPIAQRRRRPYGKLAMIFEEDTPFPPMESMPIPFKYDSTAANDSKSTDLEFSSLHDSISNKNEDKSCESYTQCSNDEGYSTVSNSTKSKKCNHTVADGTFGHSKSAIMISTCKSTLQTTDLPIMIVTDQSRLSDSLAQIV